MTLVICSLQKQVGDRMILTERVPLAQLELLDWVYQASLPMAKGNDTILGPLERKKKKERLVVGKAGLNCAWV